MNTILPQADRTRVAKLLALASSSTYPGEVQNAVRAAWCEVESHGLTWHEVLVPPDVERQGTEHHSPAPWRMTVARLLADAGRLTQWEARFCTDVMQYRSLSQKQERCLAGIADRVLNGGRGQ